MPNYKIIGANLMEHGPVSADQIRSWITERRVDGETMLQVESDTEWKRLADVPEFAAALQGSGSDTCPNCGEPFEEGFDSCWKCGTGRDGTPPKAGIPTEVDARWTERVEPCPKCGSPNVWRGRLVPVGRGSSVMFKPDGAGFFLLRFLGGVVLSSEKSSACLDCGLVWDQLRPEELKEFISNHCSERAKEEAHQASAKEDAYALLSEAVRLESKGDTAGAIAKYEAVREGFAGTEAARDAEASIRNLKEKMG